jgi:hypothetical protein
MRSTLTFLLVAAIAAGLGVGLAWPTPAAAAPAPAVAPPTSPAVAECDVIHGLTILDRDHREQLHRACVQGPTGDANSYAALFRLVSSSSWHAGVVATILHRHGLGSWTAWADGEAHDPPPALGAQRQIEAGLPGFAAGTQCPELRRSEELAAFLAAVGADERPEASPFTSRFAACLGVPARTMEGTRLLTIRADGLVDVTVIVGTRDFVHARRFGRDEALHLESHRFFVVAVPEASPVVVLGTHENQTLPVIWRGVVARNEVIWAVPPRRSCLDLSVRMDAGTHLYLDGMRIDGGLPGDVCAGEPPAADAAVVAVDQTLSITLDQRGSGLPEHEVVALTCKAKGKGGRRPVVRHASSLPATAPAEQLRPANVCEPLQLDLGTPTRQRVAVLGVAKLPGCEVTPMWASDLQERVRHVLSRDVAHQNVRDYANFSAYAEASEALATLESHMGPPREDKRSEQGSDTDQLLGSAAREAWRQGIDTLLSLAVQCTPRGQTKGGDPQWSYSIRATSIHVSELFARGYHGRDGLDLEDFIDVDSVGFDAAEQQDASIGTLLDRVFEVETPRFAGPVAHAPYRQLQTLRVSRYYSSASEGGASVSPRAVPEAIELRYKAFDGPGTRPFRDLRARQGVDDRPHPCEGLVHRGARPPDAMREAYPDLPGKERSIALQRNQDDVDASAGSGGSAVYEGKLSPPRPGWYLVMVDGDDADDELDDAVCIDATAPALELWADLASSGGPLAFARNGSRALLYMRPRVGWTRYLRGGWLGGGLSLGYGYTDYVGPRADWTDLDVSEAGRQRWRRHALLVSPYVEARSRATVIPLEFRARFGPALDSGLVDLRRVNDDLVDFRAGFQDDTILDFDVDLNLDLSVGAPLGPVQLDVLAMLTYVGVDDSLVRSATTVIQDANFYIGFGFMISGGRR